MDSKTGGMRRLPRWGAWWVGACAALLFVACGGGGGGAGDTPVVVMPPPGTTGPDYMPLAVGDTRVYRRDDGGLDRSRVTGTRVIDGLAAFLVADTDTSTGETYTTAFRKSASAVTEVPDGSDDFFTAIGASDVLRLPARVGDTYTQVEKTLPSGFDIDGDNRSDAITLRATVTVVAIESVTVPAGTFSDCLKVRTQFTQSAVGSASGQPLTVTGVADEWYAADIGVVRLRTESTTTGSTEVETRELLSWRIGTRSSDSTGPQVTSTTPARGAIAGRTVVVDLDFDEPIDAAALAAGALRILDASGSTVGTGLNQVDGAHLRSRLPTPLAAGTYTLVLDNSVQDLLGNRAAAQQWLLTIDGTAPVLVSSLPATGSMQVPLSAAIELQFDEAVTLDSVRLSVRIEPNLASGWVPYTATAVDARTVRLQPDLPLQPETAYEIHIGNSLSDTLGNVGGGDLRIAFRTGAGLFQPVPVPVNGFNSTSAVAVGDVSGDGRADLLWIAPGETNLQIRRQAADDSLDTGYTVALRAHAVCPPNSIQIADLNGDGRLDVAVAEHGCGLELLLQNSAGVLEPSVFLPTGNAQVVRVADLNRDGRADLVGVGSGTGTGTVSIWLQRSDASWGTATSVPLAHLDTLDMAIGDVNGDGRPDIVVASGGGGLGQGLGLLLQRADGGFDTGGYLAVDPVWGAWGVGVADLNGDGRDDIVTGFLGAGLALFAQGPDGRLQAIQVLAGYDGARNFHIADLNGDGRNDLVVFQQGLTPLVVATGQADGTLRRAQQVENGLLTVPGTDRLAVGDLNGDGLADIVIGGPMAMYAVPRTGTASTAAPSTTSATSARATRPLRALKAAAVVSAR